jgi:hypothetical protein
LPSGHKFRVGGTKRDKKPPSFFVTGAFALESVATNPIPEATAKQKEGVNRQTYGGFAIFASFAVDSMAIWVYTHFKTSVGAVRVAAFLSSRFLSGLWFALVCDDPERIFPCRYP